MRRYLRPRVSGLLALLVSWALASASLAADRPLVCLQPTDLLVGDRDPIQVLLIEMQRQAVLLVAREDFGAYTRDQTCGELVPADSAEYVQVLDLNAVVRKPGLRQITTTLTVRSADGKQQQVELRLKLKQYTVQDMHRLCLEGTEPLISREIPAALEQFGLHRAIRAKAAEPAIPAEIGRRLGEMNFFAQLEVLRQAHTALWQEPDSPELLSITTRAYANLGQLTRCQYDGSGKVFEARSLLYAQRMLAKHPTLPESVWTRAYACALGGIHAQALEDLQAGDRMAAGKPRPSWATAADLACRYDRKGLAELGDKDPQVRELARYLAFICLENCRSDLLLAKATKNALETSPACFRIPESSRDADGEVTGRPRGTLTRLVDALRAEFPQLIDLQTTKRSELVKDVAEAAKTLEKSSKPCEPAWAMLGNLVRQTAVLAVYREWDLRASARPLLENHALRGLLQPSQDAGGQPPQQQKRLDEFGPTFWSPPLGELAHKACEVGEGYRRNSDAMVIFRNRADNAAYDVEPMLRRLISHGEDEWIRQKAAILVAVSPYNPSGPAALVRLQKNSVPARLEELQARFPDSTELLNLIGGAHKDANRLDLAENVYAKRAAIAPDTWVLQELAACRLGLNDDSGVLKALQSLDEHSSSYEIDTARVEVAQQYARKGMYDKALPYAEKAAESGSESAMQCAANCREKLGRWDDAEAMYRSIDQAHPGPYDRYYQFCVRTGRGDRAAAGAVVRDKIPQLLVAGDRESLTSAAVYEYLEGKPDEALTHLKKSANDFSDPWDSLMAALMCDARGEAQERDRLLTAAEKGDKQFDPPPRKELQRLAAMIREACAEGAKAELDDNELERLIASTTIHEQVNLQYMAGMFYLQHAHEEAGAKLLRRCVASWELRYSVVAMAAQELRRRKLLSPQMEAPAAPVGGLPKAKAD